MKTKIFLLALLSLFLTSCSQRWCNSHFPPVSSRDSVYIETVKEIPVPIPGDSIIVEVPVNCPDQDLVDIETSKLIQQIKILNGKLISRTEIKPDTIKVTVTEIKTIVKEVIVPQPVKYVPKIVKVFAWLGGISIVLVIGWIILKFVKPKI